jgi:aldehyde dehydrogenase (NAD+)
MIAVSTDPAVAIQEIFVKQQAQAQRQKHLSVAERRERIRRIIRYVEDDAKMQGLKDAMHADFRKSEAEVLISEIGVITQHARHAYRELAQWTKPEKASAPLLLAGTQSYVQFEAKGVCLIIAPWNYPFNLMFSPLLYAIAAGNTAILKPSEMTPHTSAFMKKMITELFPEEEVAMIEGDASTAKILLDLPFDHIFFTGSPQVGKIIMAAAAKHLTSVTLELGGKSPAIVDASANVNEVAYKMAWAKCLNNGQTCIAPDYALVHESQKDHFIQAYRAGIEKLYPGAIEHGIADNPDYCRIVNDRHYQRIRRLYEDAMSKGAVELLGGKWIPEERLVPPTLLGNVSEDMLIMEEEIFGPVLPMATFQSNDEAVRSVLSRPKPLTLYIGARSRAFIQYILDNTSAGSTVVNDFLLGYANPNLPFGGVNNSGIGKYMGYYGFVAFSNEKSVIKRNFGTMSMIFPPYNKTVMFLLNRVLKRIL